LLITDHPSLLTDRWFFSNMFEKIFMFSADGGLFAAACSGFVFPSSDPIRLS
jgi:hypothetical protein